MPDIKSLQHQADEIRQLISDASETLRQANYAMETLAARLTDAPTRSAPAAEVAADAETVPEQPNPPRAGADAHPMGADIRAARLDAANGDQPPELRRRHLRWARGAQRPPPGRSEA